MNKTTVVRNACAASLGLLTLLIWASAADQKRTPMPSAGAVKAAESPEDIIMRWPPRSRNTAGLLLEKYGRPDQFDRDSLVWFHNGEWKRTIVHRKLAHRDPAVARTDILEQTIGYLVPSDKIEDLKRFNPKLEVSTVAGELTFSSESEAKNRLAMNLADEIVTGKRGVADARAYYLKTSRLSASGKSSTLLESLQFEADNTRVMTPTGADR
jgi:hypothetical protein